MLQRNWLDRLVHRGTRQQTYVTRRRGSAGRLPSSESLEVRQVMAATPIAGLSDEFNDDATLAQWNEIAQVEGWGPKGMQLNELSINASQSGRMVIQPHTGGWYEDYRGALTFKEVTGDFVITSRVRITDRDNIGGNDADNIPNDSQYSLGGLMIRTPRAITNGLTDWQPGNRQDDGTNNGENYVFLSMGFTTGPRNFSFEVKTTRNSRSQLETTALGQTPNEVELQIARIGTSVITLYRLEGQTDWTVHRRYSRPDMPATMQVGMVAYTDWDKMAGITPPVHNTNVLAPGRFPNDPTPSQPFNPDITASYDFARFARPDVPAALQGIDLVTTATEAQLLSFLGDNAVIDPDAPPAPGSISGTVFNDLDGDGVHDVPPTLPNDFRFEVYGDRVINDWRLVAQGTASVTEASNAQAFGGTSSMQVGLNGWNSAVEMQWNGVFPRTLEGYEYLSLRVHGGGTAQTARIGFQSVGYTFIGGPTINIPANEWAEVRVPFAAVGNPAAIRGISLLPNGAEARSFFVDEIALIGVGTVADRPAEPTPIDHGVNLLWNVDWSFDGAFTDVSRTFRDWGTAAQPWVHPEFPNRTAQGVPTEDFGTLFITRGYGSGIYRLRFEGAATFSVGGSALLVPGTLQTTNGVTTADIQVFAGETEAPAPDFNAPTVFLAWRGVTANDPVRNIKLMAPGYDFETTQTYRSEFLHRLQPFSTIRTMQFTETNTSIATDWNVRHLPSHAIQTQWGAASGGVAWEFVVDLANESGKDIWINVPHAADDNYIRELARLWHERLDPDLKLYVEMSNELWNWQFPQTHAVNGDFYNRVAPRTADISRIFREEFGADRSRLEIVLAGQAAWDVHLDRGLQYFVDNGINPSDVIDAISTAPYFGSFGQHATLDSLFQQLGNLEFNEWMMRQNERIADFYGLKHYAYEGGQHVNQSDVASAQMLYDAQYDPRMADIYTEYMQNWNEHGGDLFVHYNFTGTSFGLLNSIRTPGSEKWDAVLRYILPAGDATLNHSVDFADFAVIRDNFGQSSRWWEQGDFDGNNSVNAADFELLVSNVALDALTPAQRAEIEAFAATNGLSLQNAGSNLSTTSGNNSSTSTTEVEPGLGGVTVYLDLNNNGAHDGNEASVVTDASGHFRFSNVAPGSYVVRAIALTDFDFTTPLTGAIPVTLDPAEAEAGLLFGLQESVTPPPPPVENHAPVFNAVADQAVNEGSTLNFSVSATDQDAHQTLTYSLGEDAPTGMTINAQTGAIHWTPSDAEGDDVYLVTVIATDNGSPAMSDESTFAITVSNVAPTARITGPSDVMRGQAAQFTLTANDPSAVDRAAGFSFEIDWESDGVVDEVIVGPSGTVVPHVFSAAATFNISVVAYDKEDAASAPATTSTRVINTGLIQDPVDPTRTTLLILGTGSNDVIQVLTTSIAGRLQVKVNNRIAGAFSPTGRIIISGYAGNDTITLDSRITLPAELDGGAGNDTLTGASGNDIILGGAGDDSLNGSGGRDILIGGSGRDRANGGSGEDILIGGTTTHQIPALRSIMAEWSNAQTYAQRVASLSRTGAGLLTLNPGSTVLDDSAVDEIWGAGSPDWLFARLEGSTSDVLRDRISSETVTPL